jgi:hypothetical protein
MAIDRYQNTDIIGFGESLGTSRIHIAIRNGIKNGNISYKTITLQGVERLDTIAGRYYGDGRYWWIIAAASQIGWAPQCPAGTVLTVPNINQIMKLFT